MPYHVQQLEEANRRLSVDLRLKQEECEALREREASLKAELDAARQRVLELEQERRDYEWLDEVLAEGEGNGESFDGPTVFAQLRAERATRKHG